MKREQIPVSSRNVTVLLRPRRQSIARFVGMLAGSSLILTITLIGLGKPAVSLGPNTNTAGPEDSIPCAGDCDGDQEVTVDELVTLSAIALGDARLDCAAGDSDKDGQVTVDEITAAIWVALMGCSDVPIDLIAVSAEPHGCFDTYCANDRCYSCGPYRFRLCVANHGGSLARGVVLAVNGFDVETVPSVSPGETTCRDVRYGAFRDGVFDVDPHATIDELDRSNNRLRFPQPNPTGCDVICPNPEPTFTPPPPRPTSTSTP